MKPGRASVFAKGVSAFQSGQSADAERYLRKFLRDEPRHFGALNLLGITLMQSSRFGEAEPYFKRATALDATSDVTFYNYGLVLKSLGKTSEAMGAFDRAIALKQDVPETWTNRGSVFNSLRRYDDAIADFDTAISINPDYWEAYYNKGNSLLAMGRADDARLVYQDAQRVNPGRAETFIGLGNVHAARAECDEAMAAYRTALARNPKLASAWNALVQLLLKLQRFDEALTANLDALKFNPESASIWMAQGDVFAELHRMDEALGAFDRAIALDPALAEAHLRRGNICGRFRHHSEALACFDQALALNPDLAGAWMSRGQVFTDTGRHEEAARAFEAARAINPGEKFVKGMIAYAHAQACHWDGLKREWEDCIADIDAGFLSVNPAVSLTMPTSPAQQFACASRFAADHFPQDVAPLWTGKSYTHDRIRVAYMSADFHDHPVSLLFAGVLEAHDRKAFETFAISLGGNEQSEMRRRIHAAVDRFVDARALPGGKIASMLHDMEIDIVVDLSGYTEGNRLDALAYRPAPVHAVFFGYAGTTGARFVDYIIADRIVIPPEHEPFYAERVVRLPNSFMPNDNTRRISDAPLGRRAFGLPENGFVFCAFNNAFKITPDIFDVWMNLLHEVEGSVLWLSPLNREAKSNISSEAQRRGVTPERIVFAERIERHDEHLARLALADLFLDTVIYNAHATACDALWSGLPVLTSLGSTFAGRVGASLLNAVGLPELVTASLDDYATMAFTLARDSKRLAAIKERLITNRMTHPLFDTARFTRDLEAAYGEMLSERRAAVLI